MATVSHISIKYSCSRSLPVAPPNLISNVLPLFCALGGCLMLSAVARIYVSPPKFIC